jgi:hypothetical protein
MNLSTISVGDLLTGFLFGMIGLYTFRVAKRDANLVAVMLSIALMGYSWVMPNVWANFAVGSVLTVLTIRALKN